jgi:hypothetical protein
MEEIGETIRPTDREPDGLVEVSGRRVQIDRSIPEVAERLHAVGVVPDVGANGSMRCSHSAPLQDGSQGVWDEVERQPTDHDIKGIIGEGQVLATGNPDVCLPAQTGSGGGSELD